MMKLTGYILAAATPLAWGVDEATSYAEGLERVKEDGWVLLCHSADWDSSHDEQWIRRQTSISSACGNALVLYVPIYQNPTPEQAQAVAELLKGAPVDLSSLRSVPCALLLDRDGRAYATISGDDFTERAAGMIRHAQSQLRSRESLLRQATDEEGPQKAQTLSSIWRLTITPPPGLKEQMQAADPNDSAGIAEWSPFDPWALAERVRTMSYEDAIAELDRVQQAQLSKEERQAVLAIRMSCVRQHLRAAGVIELRRLAKACAALAPNTPLGKAAPNAVRHWDNRINLSKGWTPEQLPLIATECEFTGTQMISQKGDYRIVFTPTAGQDPLRVTRVTLYDRDNKVSEDTHTCSLKAGEELKDNEYMLIVREAPAHPRLVVSFDQQGKTDSCGTFTVRYFTEDGIEYIATDPTKAATDQAKKDISGLDTQTRGATSPLDNKESASATTGKAGSSATPAKPAEPAKKLPGPDMEIEESTPALSSPAEDALNGLAPHH